ncbi:MAG TPA: hypothetical protein PLV68_04395, partial [Ilumatobacteraceae bacterium]|nr:hypothetical protein [Ilumatobacteraceae bacterium]
MKSTLDPYWYAGAPNVAFAFSSDETPGAFTYKELNASLVLTWDKLPYIPDSGQSPAANPYLFHDHLNGISLSIPPLTDPDGETLYYRFVLCATNTWVGCAGSGMIRDDSGWLSSPSYSKWLSVGFPASWYNQQLYWGVQVSNLTSSGYVMQSWWMRPWKLYNNSAASPSLISPVDGFTWVPSAPPTLQFSTPSD